MARTLHQFVVRRTERLNDHLIRVHLGGPGFAAFQPSEFTDSYVKLQVPGPDGDTTRTYTVRAVDTAAETIAIDFVYHGAEGVAGPWAAAARPGDAIGLSGPGGAYAPRADADWHLLAGDISALPAISAACAALPANAVGRVFVEVAGPADELDFARPEGVELTWLHTGGAEPGALLVEAVRAEPWRDGLVHVFIHGEAQAVMHNLRSYIRKERGVPADWASISGYWRRGRTEEGFRQWKRDLAEREAATVG
ncbi:Siderophore-interacting protein [Catenulispora acidiphila DSM 44928]|uniref:Siderophore-interacting protein n=1 Tax=Catenulispora acidiphila (strain DSM 44928 / JCM 14897 / NBRC 102108 / NRRL B-24433 / ID139908) TaxID=479433 RepID=C7Q999_CATAD|nr:siderophore-interacting protein [Catenulispora acidiphila]ACU74245.1 Siderophore-interacting protein [Catenulispora acidiphila DSM 44928]